MKKKRSRRRRSADVDTMRPEYDFSKGVRVATLTSYMRAMNAVVIDPDVLDVFPDSASVNEALRALAVVIRRRDRSRGREALGVEEHQGTHAEAAIARESVDRLIVGVVVNDRAHPARAELLQILARRPLLLPSDVDGDADEIAVCHPHRSPLALVVAGAADARDHRDRKQCEEELAQHAEPLSTARATRAF